MLLAQTTLVGLTLLRRLRFWFICIYTEFGTRIDTVDRFSWTTAVFFDNFLALINYVEYNAFKPVLQINVESWNFVYARPTNAYGCLSLTHLR